MANILSRLPTKSFARMRCVCKQLRSLTYDPHLLNSLQVRPSSLRILSRYVTDDEIIVYDFKATAVGEKLKDNSYKISNPGLKWSTLSNSLNGLICLYSYRGRHNIYILNPTTQEHMKLPKQQTTIGPQMMSGLGIDDSTGDYKVVSLSFCDRLRICNCEILTLRTGQWRWLGEIPCEVIDYPPVFIQGALHWVAQTARADNAGYQNILLKVCIKEETFQLAIPLPQFPERVYIKDMGEFEGRICFAALNMKEKELEIWTLEDYANHNWIKMHHLKVPGGYLDFIGTSDNKIFLELFERDTQWNVYCHNPYDKTLHRLFDDAMPGLFLHRESLISPTELLGDHKDFDKTM